MFFTDRNRQLSFIFLSGLLLLLTACGGGGGSSTASTSESNATVQPAGSQTQNDAAESSATQPVNSGDQATDSAIPNPPSPQLKEITLQWQSPSTRSDGTPLSLSEISGYNIYYSEQSGQYGNAVYVKGGHKMQVTIEGLTPGRYYLSMTTIDDLGLESSFSSQLVVRI